MMSNIRHNGASTFPLSVLIIGGGIAGLAAAIFLERKGYKSEIIERSEEPNCTGGGITLTLNGVRILNTIGLGRELEAKGAVINSIEITNRNNKRISSFNVEKYNNVYAKTISIHRSHLHRMLEENLFSTTIHYNTTFKTIEDGGKKVKVIFNNGREKYYDLVIGCDGMNSSVRRNVFNHDAVKHAGYACWRFIVDNCTEIDPGIIKEMWGRGKRIGIVPINKEKVHCFASVNTAPRSEKYKKLPLADFKLLFRDFKGDVPQLINKLHCPTQLFYSDLGDVYLKSWVKGRIVLIGDAAHGMTPNMTQGASMAIEDAMMLSQYLSKSVPVERSLDAFFLARRKRVIAVQNRSNWLGKIGQLESHFFSGLRNFCWKQIPDSWIQKDFEKILI